ncbi:MAG: PQQ-binding-like beta-propeller repeat protein [Saprospiraceae bacterium]|nr:PQQ-binding-like beta-propeller repeat protein [Saprospiraceae bacterium]
MTLLITLILAIMAGCCKEGLPDPPPCSSCPDTTMMHVWQHDLDTLSGEESLFGDPLIYQGNPIFMIFDQWDCQFGSANRVTCLDANTGTKLWGFDVDDPCTTIENGYIFEDILVLNMSKELAGYDLISLEKVWSIPLNSPLQGSKGLTGIGDKVYLSITYGTPPLEPTSALLGVHILSGASQEILRFERLDWDAYPKVHPPSLWVNPSNGDSILMTAVGLYEDPTIPDKARHSLHAYNLNSKSYAWEVDSIGIPSNNLKRVEVYDNKVYMVTDYRVHCFDAFIGKKIWSTTIPCCTQYVSNFLNSRLLVVNNKVIANPSTDNMYCLDANTGEILWEVPEYTATANQDLLEYNGVIYLSSFGYGLLVGIDLETGEVLMKESSPNVNPSFSGQNVIVNPDKNLLFVNDSKSAFAYRPVR